MFHSAFSQRLINQNRYPRRPPGGGWGLGVGLRNLRHKKTISGARVFESPKYGECLQDVGENVDQRSIL
jgi:hypothetical protein